MTGPYRNGDCRPATLRGVPQDEPEIGYAGASAARARILDRAMQITLAPVLIGLAAGVVAVLLPV